jgi:hypothetical protein
MKKIKFHIQFAEFVGLGLAYQPGIVAILIPFVMLEISWSKK